MSDAPKVDGIERIKITSRDQWLKLRDQDVTASAVGALFGCHPYVTALGVWCEKTGVEIKDFDNSVLRRGRLLESAVAAGVAEQHPEWFIEKADVYLRDPSIRLGATPDFFVRDDKGRRGVLQTKTVSRLEFERSWDETNAPLWISLQTLTETHLDGADFGAIGVMIVDPWKLDVLIYDVPRHRDAEERIRKATEKFWTDVDAGQEPKADYTRDRALLAMMWPHETAGKIVDLRHDNRLPELLAERERVKADAKVAKSRQDEIDAEIIDKLQDAEAASIRGWRLSYKEQRRKGYSVPATSFRVLRASQDFSEKSKSA